MKYSNYLIEQIASPIYKQVAEKLLSQAKNEDIIRKMQGILYEGGFDNFSINGEFSMEKEVPFKNNPRMEALKRLNMAYLLLTNPKMIDVMQQTGAAFFHGTNANALPNILKYGINSVDKSRENNIEVTTGEECTIINGKRNFVSLTDCIDVSLTYAGINNENSKDQLLNFGVIAGISFQNMEDIRTIPINSDISEIGVRDNLPLDHIKFLAVPKDKEEFVKKLVGEKNIEIVGMDLNDTFHLLDYDSKLKALESYREENVDTKTTSKTFNKEDVKTVVKTRRFSKIKEIFANIKNKFRNKNRAEKNNDGNDLAERS